MNISNTPTLTLIEDYKKLEQLEIEYFTICKKYNDSTYEPNESSYNIIQELGYRQVNGTDVKTAEIPENQKEWDSKKWVSFLQNVHNVVTHFVELVMQIQIWFV